MIQHNKTRKSATLAITETLSFIVTQKQRLLHMKLLVSQKDLLYDFIVDEGLSPTLFEFIESKSAFAIGETATTLVCKKTEYYFCFENQPQIIDDHFAIYCPGTSKYIERVDTILWENQIEHFKLWLKILKRELTSENKWDILFKELVSLNLNFQDNHSDSEKFSVKEFEDLKIRIKLLQDSIINSGYQKEQAQTLNKKLDKLLDYAKDMSKIDWKGLFVGSIISTSLQIGLSQSDLAYLKDAISHIFNNFLVH